MSDAKDVRRGAVIDKLGPEVRVTNESAQPDTWASNTLRDIGKAMKNGGDDYAGSLAVHYYISSSSIKQAEQHALWKCQIVGAASGEGLGDRLNEMIASFSLADLAKNLRKHYDPSFEHKTLNEKDERK